MLVVLNDFGQARAGMGNFSAVHASVLANGNKMSILIHKSLQWDREIAVSVNVEL